MILKNKDIGLNYSLEFLLRDSLNNHFHSELKEAIDDEFDCYQWNKFRIIVHDNLETELKELNSEIRNELSNDLMKLDRELINVEDELNFDLWYNLLTDLKIESAIILGGLDQELNRIFPDIDLNEHDE